MKRYFKGLYMSFGMFCAIPLPYNLWDDGCMNLMLPCFPLVGAVLGAIWWALAELLVFCGLHTVPASAILGVLPFVLTGFLHLDGYMDTSDAVMSRRPLEDKLRILKDPHTGAFSVIMIAVLFTMQFAAVYAVLEKGKHFALCVAIFAISRCASALSVLCLSKMPQSGYANMFGQNAKTSHRVFIACTAALAAGAAYMLAGLIGLVVAGVTALGSVLAMWHAYSSLKGVSGDLAGYALVIGELCGLFALALV